MKALKIRETEKAIQISFDCRLFMKKFRVECGWFPKSFFSKLEELEDGEIEFEIAEYSKIAFDKIAKEAIIMYDPITYRKAWTALQELETYDEADEKISFC